MVTGTGIAPSSELRDVFRIAVTRVPPGDCSGLWARAEAAGLLGRRAFAENDRSAWEVVQAIEWRLQRRSALRPTDPGDVLVLDALYRAEEATLPDDRPPRGLTPNEFCAELARTIAGHTSAGGKLVELMQTGDLGREDWKFFGYQWLTSAIDFTRQIAVCSLSLPREQARLLYMNLYDEIGRGDWARAHWNLLTKFLENFGVLVDDEETILTWTAPDVLAMANTQNRLLWRSEPGWALGSMFLAERLVPSELGQVREAVRRMQLQSVSTAFFDDHVVTDVAHADDWQAIIEGNLVTEEQQRVVHAAALQRGRAQRRAWDAAFEAWRIWKETGTPPHIPFAELEAVAP